MTVTETQHLAAKLALLETRVERLERVLGEEPKKPKPDGDLSAAFEAGAKRAKSMFGEDGPA